MIGQLPAIFATLGAGLMSVAILAPGRIAAAATPIAPRSLRWTGMVDPAAVGAGAATRAELVRALVDVDAPWAETILDCAALEDDDPLVCAALADRQRAYRRGSSEMV